MNIEAAILSLALSCLILGACGSSSTGADEPDAALPDADASGDAGDGSGDVPADGQDGGADPAGDGNYADGDAGAEDDGLEDADQGGMDTGDGGSDAGDEAPDAGDGHEPPLPPGCVQGNFYPFWGNLHSHSKFSDGDGTAEEAFAHARDVARLDIMVLTDHMEQLMWPPNEYETCRQIADTFYQPGVYLADCGFEFATALFGLTGHNNVFFSPNLFRLSVDFEDFYRQLAACRECIAAFNHPGDSAGHTWKNFQYDADADVNLNLIEFNTDADPWAYYFQALDAGWHVSPTYNQDNHGRDWGSKNGRRSGYFLSALTREALHQAMQDRRSFMSFDKNAWIKMMAQQKCWMGSILSRLSALELEVSAYDADAGEGFAKIELYGPQATLIYGHDCAGSNPCSFRHTVPVAQTTYVTARATQTDGDYLVGAPIWATP